MTDETKTSWACPKDGTEMAPMGWRGRGGAWRCPTCRGIFIDTEVMRRGRAGQPPVWGRVVWSVAMSVLVSLLATVVVRRLRQRPTRQASSA